MLIGSIALFLLAAILFLGLLLLPSLAMAQLQQQQQQTTTTITPPSLSITTIPPLTPEEQAQQDRLQNVIAATTRDLNETEKQVSEVVFTPRWSEPLWINANSIAVLIAYCLPGEFADSGQEILGGFGLEVLESYAVDLPQGFMAWMAVVGNQDDDDDVQNGRRLPAALGVICASDLNRADTRILSPQEQQEINNINQQFTTIQNTQITNIDQVINIIENVTSTTTPPAQNETGEGGTTPPPPTNDTGGVTEQPLRVEIVPNATEGVDYTRFRLEAKVTGGTEPYIYQWGLNDAAAAPRFPPGNVWEFILYAGENRFVIITVTDSENQTASDSIQLTVERPFTAEIVTNATQAVAPASIRFDAHIFGGAPPYSYSWSVPDFGVIDQDRGITQMFFDPGTFTYTLSARDSDGQTVSDSVQIVIRERLGGGVLPPPETGEEGQPPGGGGLLPGITPGEEEQPQAPPTVPEEGEPTTGGGEEDTGETLPETGEEPSPPSPPSDDTGGEESPPDDEEEPTTPPEGGG
jgi:hypothetical protein